MSRALQTISLLLLASSIYLLLLLPLLTDPTSFSLKYLQTVAGSKVASLGSAKIPSFLPATVQDEIVPILPFWVIVSLGAYLLGRLGLGVMQFKDCEIAYKELTVHIEKAKKGLDSRNVGWS